MSPLSEKTEFFLILQVEAFAFLAWSAYRRASEDLDRMVFQDTSFEMFVNGFASTGAFLCFVSIALVGALGLFVAYTRYARRRDWWPPALAVLAIAAAGSQLASGASSLFDTWALSSKNVDTLYDASKAAALFQLTSLPSYAFLWIAWKKQFEESESDELDRIARVSAANAMFGIVYAFAVNFSSLLGPAFIKTLTQMDWVAFFMGDALKSVSVVLSKCILAATVVAHACCYAEAGFACKHSVKAATLLCLLSLVLSFSGLAHALSVLAEYRHSGATDFRDETAVFAAYYAEFCFLHGFAFYLLSRKDSVVENDDVVKV